MKNEKSLDNLMRIATVQVCPKGFLRGDATKDHHGHHVG